MCKYANVWVCKSACVSQCQPCVSQFKVWMCFSSLVWARDLWQSALFFLSPFLSSFLPSFPSFPPCFLSSFFPYFLPYFLRSFLPFYLQLRISIKSPSVRPSFHAQLFSNDECGCFKSHGQWCNEWRIPAILVPLIFFSLFSLISDIRAIFAICLQYAINMP